MKNDSVILNTEEFYDSINDVKLAIDKVEEIGDEISTIEKLAYGTKIDISQIKSINNAIRGDLYKIYPSLSKTKTKISDLETIIDRMKLKDSSEVNRRLDALKGLNPDVGGVRVEDTSSLLDLLRNKIGVNLIMDIIKTRGNTGCVKSLDAVSALVSMEEMEYGRSR